MKKQTVYIPHMAESKRRMANNLTKDDIGFEFYIFKHKVYAFFMGDGEFTTTSEHSDEYFSVQGRMKVQKTTHERVTIYDDND